MIHHEIALLTEVDIGKLANGFGLLQLPKMPELKGKVIGGFKKREIDVKSIPYKDKTRERQRQMKLKEGNEKEMKKSNIEQFKNKSWSKEKEKQAKRKVKKEKKNDLKRKRNITGYKFDDDEVDELSKEVRLMKKLKRGKITKDEFEIAVKDENDSDSS